MHLFVCTLHYLIIIIMQTYLYIFETSKILVNYILLSVYLRLSQFAQLPFMQYMGLCEFILPIYIVMIERKRDLYLIIIIKSEVWTICLGVGHETKVCAISRVSCQKGPTHHAYAWQIGPFWQETLNICFCVLLKILCWYWENCYILFHTKDYL